MRVCGDVDRAETFLVLSPNPMLVPHMKSKQNFLGHRIANKSMQCETINKFALLWGEAQLCLPYVCLIAYSYLKVT